ncbi:MAG: type II toxin-antitoxin system HipA family toxin [Gammaproteobacteria bacterium]
MTERRQRYDLYLNTAATGITRAAEIVLLEHNGRLTEAAFRYTPDYLAMPSAFSLDPVQAPLTPNTYGYNCQMGPPGLIDDYLPDDWGRRVLAHLSLYQRRAEYHASSVINTLDMLGGSRVGAISIVPRDKAPCYELGADIAQLEKAEQAAQQVDSGDYAELSVDEASMLYLANNGTGLGGARPKALIYGDGCAYVAKFNRLSQDGYNNARVEQACLRMAAKAGIRVPNTTVRAGINGREVLLVERFDINADLSRNHLVSIHALLNEASEPRSTRLAFRYDDIHSILQHHSDCIEADSEQLLRLMLFNRMIHNVDDHERNFSLLHDGENFCLAPAYDLTPSLARGAYHIAGFGYGPMPPHPREARSLGKVFGLPKTVVSRCAEEVQAAGEQWMEIATQSGVDEETAELLHRSYLG